MTKNVNSFVRYFEIPAVDFHRAVTFYEKLFELELSKCEFDTEKMAFFPKEELNITGMISWAKDFVPSKDGIVVYFDATGKLDEQIAKAVSIGGKTLTPKTKIEADNHGSFALLQDSEGNRFGLYGD